MAGVKNTKRAAKHSSLCLGIACVFRAFFAGGLLACGVWFIVGGQPEPILTWHVVPGALLILWGGEVMERPRKRAKELDRVMVHLREQWKGYRCGAILKIDAEWAAFLVRGGIAEPWAWPEPGEAEGE